MIRMKVKTLVLILALLTFLGWVGYMQVPLILYKMEKYDTLLKWFPDNSLAQSALDHLAGEPFGHLQGDDRIFIFTDGNSSSSGSNTVDREELPNEIKQLENLVRKYSTSNSINNMKYRLTSMYLWNKEWDKAEALFTEIRESNVLTYRSKEIDDNLTMLATRHVSLERQPLVTGKVMIGGKPAADVYVVLHRKDDNGWSSPPFGHYPIAITGQDGGYRFYDEVASGEYKVGVGVTPEQVNGNYLGDQEKQYVKVMDGKTDTYDVLFSPQVKVVSPINKEIITGDKLKFDWEPYPGASYYQLSITDFMRDENDVIVGAHTYTMQEERWEGTTAEYSLDRLRQYPRGFGKSQGREDNKVVLSTSGILGMVYPGGHFIWSVGAYDQDGKLLSSSNGYYTTLNNTTPFFSMDDSGMLEGDKLVMQGDYEAAIRSYEAEINNDYALRALALMTSNGFSRTDNGDPVKALSYLRKIAELSEYDKQLIKSAEDELQKQ